MKPLSLKIQQLEESQTLAFSLLARKMVQSGIDVVSLTAGEPDFPTPPHVKMAAIRAIDENFTHYTPNQGIPDLIEAIRRKFECDNKLHFDPSQILVSCGAKHSIFNALQALCNKGDEVVVAAPYWVSYPEMVKLADAKPIIVTATHETNFKITPLQLRKAINQKTKAFIFNSPSNPTGTLYSQGEIEEFADVVAETGIYVISDEIYEKVVYDGMRHFSIGSIKEIADQVVTVNGVSKAYAMTGWRIGYLGAAKPIAEAATKVQSQTTSNANSIAQRAAAVALTAATTDVAAMVTEFARRRDFVTSELFKIPGIILSPPKGAFYLFPNVESYMGKRLHGGKIIRDDLDLAQYLLEECQVATVPGGPFGLKNHIRLSYASSMKDLEKAIVRLQRGFKALADAY